MSWGGGVTEALQGNFQANCGHGLCEYSTLRLAHPPPPGDRSVNSSSFPKIHGPLHPREWPNRALLEAHCARTVLGRGHHLAALGLAFL